MKKFLMFFLILIVSPSIASAAESTKHVAMKKELRQIHLYYQDLYDKNSQIDQIYKKITDYRSNPPKGMNEFASKEDIEGLASFEILQTKREATSDEVYKKYQSDDYIAFINEYNQRRKTLRLALAQKKITWRQFVDDLEMQIIQYLDQEKEFWNERPTIEKEMT